MPEPTGRLVIRSAGPEDRDAIRELTRTAYADYERIMTPLAWAGLKEAVVAAVEVWEGVDWIVAEFDGRIVGSVVVFPPSADAYRGAVGAAPWPELRLLSVSPAARGRGIGRALVEECARRAAATGASTLGLHTSRSMADAIRLYEAMGFVRAPEYDFRPDGAELVTAYRLPLDQGG
jgi:GNAT superfamily N-acetyltransferase